VIGRRTLVRAVAALLLALSIATVVTEARPGGGETYSTGRSGRTTSRGYGGDSGDDGGLAFVVFVLQLCWRYPLVGIPFLLIVVAFVALNAVGGGRSANWDSTRSVMHTPDEAPLPQAATAPLTRIARADPDFSAVLFEDFAFRLYAAAHLARGAGTLDELSPYLSASARQSLAARQPAGPVTGVVVGAMRTREVYVPRVDGNRPDAFVRVALEFEANYSAGSGDGATFVTTIRVSSSWTSSPTAGGSPSRSRSS